MKFYRNHYHTNGGNSDGYAWFTTRQEAIDAANEVVACDPSEYRDDPPTIADVIHIKLNKAGVLFALRTYASHPDNG